MDEPPRASVSCLYQHTAVGPEVEFSLPLPGLRAEPSLDPNGGSHKVPLYYEMKSFVNMHAISTVLFFPSPIFTGLYLTSKAYTS